jgi:hypothetical protein
MYTTLSCQIKCTYRFESGISDVIDILAFAFSMPTLPVKFDVLPLIFIFSCKNRS